MKLERSWYEKLVFEIQKPYILQLKAFLHKERKGGASIYPPEPLIFNAFLQTPFDQVKVVIVGQDPYHKEGQAHGLSFSVPYGIRPPPSLKTIFKELYNDVGILPSSHGCLDFWAKQGVFLLNATLTVRAGEPKSHYEKGWEIFTDAVIEQLIGCENRLIFLLWGKVAREKCRKIVGAHHMLLEAAHPSPYSAQQFLGCRHFSKTNELLIKMGKQPIDWSLKTT